MRPFSNLTRLAAMKEMTWLLPPDLTESADEVTGKAHVHGDIVASNNHHLDGYPQVC